MDWQHTDSRLRLTPGTVQGEDMVITCGRRVVSSSCSREEIGGVVNR
jgi:hypothetical protein